MMCAMINYLTSKKLKSMPEGRRAELDLLFDFVNADMTPSENQFLQTCILDHLLQHPALHPDNRSWRPDGNLFNIMDALQRHLRSRLGAIIDNKLMLGEMALWQIGGSVKFTLHPIENQFYEQFQIRKVKRGSEINALKKILNLWLIEIIRDLDFSPRRFGKCPRCGSFFYSSTLKERIYCSTRCGGAARQEKFRKERREKDK